MMGIMIAIGGGLVMAIVYVCRKTVCERNEDLDIVSAMDITYNDIYRKV